MTIRINKSVGIAAAKIAGRDPIMDTVANATKDKLQAVSAASSKTGNFADSWRVREVRGKKGVTDRMIDNTDPGAVAINYGHVQGSTHVPGIFVVEQVLR